LLLARYEKEIKSGFDDLERFELIDRLKKPVLYFAFSGTKRLIIELHDYLSQFPYSFFIRTNKGLDIWNLPELGTRNAHVHISRFPNLIKFIQDNENSISNDMWGLLYGSIRFLISISLHMLGMLGKKVNRMNDQGR
jgi:hypothetical protein